MKKTFALALGGGGARALAQIPVIEALDELGIRPVAVSGTSFGAVIAAAYCAGMTGKEIRKVAIELSHDRSGTLSRIARARASSLSDWLASPFGNPLLLDPVKVCTEILPKQVPDDFSKLKIPLTVAATDLYGRTEAVIDAGPLHSAVAASIAVPALMRPVERDGRVLVDGAAVNPLPFDHLRGKADVIVAVDVALGPGTGTGGVPEPWEALAATMALIGHGIMERKLAEGAPDLILRPNVDVFRLFDFFRGSAVMRAAEPVKAQAKERLTALIGTAAKANRSKADR